MRSKTMKIDQKKPEMASRKIRKGDKVVAITGNDKGRSGTVIACKGEYITVQGLRMRKKHVKKSQQAPNGGIIDMEQPIHVSNLKICNDQGQPVKLRVRQQENGEREFYYLDGEQQVSYRSIKNPKISAS